MLTTMERRPLTEQEIFWKDNLKRIWTEKKKSLGLTQDKLAELCGWKTQGAVSNYMNGRMALNTDAKLKFAKALEVPVSDIDPAMKDLAVQRINQKRAIEFMNTYGEDIASLSEKEKIKLIALIEKELEDAKNGN